MSFLKDVAKLNPTIEAIGDGVPGLVNLAAKPQLDEERGRTQEAKDERRSAASE